MVEFGNNLDLDEDLDVLHNILDFPMECLEEDEVAEDCDMNNPLCFGPIPSNVLMGLSMMSDESFNLRSPSLFPRPVAPIPPKRKLAKAQESGSFCTQSPASIQSDNPIPVQSRSKRVKSKQISNARSKESMKISFQQPAAMDLVENSYRNVASLLDISDPAHLQNTTKLCPAPVKKCAHCQTTKTTLWRWGPLGRNTLCNACGLQYRSGRLFPEYRPAASPTFVPSQHSNSQAKVVRMRDKAKQLTVKIKIPPKRKLAKAQESGSFCTQSPVSFQSDNPIPVQSRSNRVRSKQTSNARSKESRKISFQQPAAIDLVENSHRNVASLLDISDPAQLQNTSKPCPAPVKKCAHCQTTMTTQWRWGPLGRNTLCNACGIQYRSGRLFPEYRPATSPTFVPSQHSNSPAKVVRMRDKAKQLTVKIKIPTVKAAEQIQLAKHIDTSSSLIPPHIVGAPEQEHLTKHIDIFVEGPERKQLEKYVDISCSLIPPQIAGVPEHEQLPDHVDTSSSLSPLLIAGAPNRKQLAKHVYSSSLLIPSHTVEAPEQKQLAKHVDTSSSLIPPPIAGATKQKGLAKYYGTTCSSHIPLQNKFTNVQVSGTLCPEKHVPLLESSGSSLRVKSSSIMSNTSKCMQPVKENTLFLESPSTLKRTSKARIGEECRKKSRHGPAAMDVLKSTPKNDERLLDVSDPARILNASQPRSAVFKKFAHCETTETPQSKLGLLGKHTLCACGIRYRSECLLPEYRPEASPTFMPSQNSKCIQPVKENTLLLASPSTLNKTSKARIGEECRKKSCHGPAAIDVLKRTPKNDESLLDVSDPARMLNASKPCSAVFKSVEAPEQKQLAKHVDTSSSLIPPPIAGATKRKWLAKYYGTTCNSHIPLQNKFTNVQVSGTLCTEKHVPLLESSCSSLRVKSSSIMSNTSKCMQPVKENTLLLASPSTLTRIGEECWKKSRHGPAAIDVLKSTPKNDESLLDVSDPARVLNASKPRPAVFKKCAHCETTDTPRWRLGPLGKQTLCNACGIRYRSGWLLPEYRPVASPTFMPSQNSNSRSRALEMRIKALTSTAESMAVHRSPGQKLKPRRYREYPHSQSVLHEQLFS